MKTEGTEDSAWKVWDKWPEYGDILYRRATGDEAEMESSKATAIILSRFYTPGMKVLDVGCGAGHYYYSLKKRVDPNLDYYGVDLTEHYVELARKAHAAPERFFVGDVRQLPFENRAFDVVLCINTLVNLPPPPTRAFRELTRVAKEYVVIRALFGERNYIIKEVRNLDESSRKEIDLIAEDGAILEYHYSNMYTEAYYRQALEQVEPDAELAIEKDTYWESFDDRSLLGPTATRGLGDRQVSGNLIFDWRFLILRKKRSPELSPSSSR